jgi:acyl-CoA thioester hydrolase
MEGRSYSHTIDVQYRDLDPRSHVNHAVFVSYMEQAKGAFFAEVLGTPLEAVNTVVKALEVDYERPIPGGSAVTIELQVATVGETSLGIAYELTVDDDVVATANTVSVLLDSETDRPQPLSEDWRERLEPYRQE